MNDATGAQAVRALRAVDAALPAIPERVFWDDSTQTFRDEAGNEADEGFAVTWHPRREEFPRWEDKVAAKDPATPAPADNRDLAEIGRDENDKLFNGIGSDLTRQHTILDRLDGEIAAQRDKLMDLGDERRKLDDKIDLGQAALGELETQRHEAISRIDLLGQLSHSTKMHQLRRAHA